MKSFASDNYASVHPDILKAIEEANCDHAPAYGYDEYTAKAENLFKQHFGEQVEVFFVFLGTGANVLALEALTQRFDAVLCAKSAHINTDECGAPDRFAVKLIALPEYDGKIQITDIEPYLSYVGFEHNVQPRVISITQSTEYGTLYLIEEMKQIIAFAHQHNLYVHVDGARICNAAAALNVSLKQLTTDLGVDVLSFGGTKNGMMFGEAVVFFKPELAQNFKLIRKQGMQLASKMRYISAQFIAILSNDLWKKNASHANHMAKLLAEKLAQIPEIKITKPVEVNAVFATVPPKMIQPLQAVYPFYVWDEATAEVRWMTAFDTTEDDIERFVKQIKSHFNH